MTVQGIRNAGFIRLFPVSNNKNNSGHINFAQNNSSDSFELSQSFVKSTLAKKLNEIAEELSGDNKNEEAIIHYNNAIIAKPDYIAPYYGLSRVYKKTGQTKQAIETYNQLLQFHPEEIEAQTLSGHCYKKLEDYENARKSFQKAYEQDPKYDFASRSLKEIDNLILMQSNPKLAAKIKNEQVQNNLKASLNIITQASHPSIIKKLSAVNYSFDNTDALSGHQNIAQYEHNKKRIVITDEYIWAAPEVIAAYLAHENIHAADKDGITSVYEEQDAYEASIKFWIHNNNGVKDPELDYAADLYQKSPQVLRDRVAVIYRSRDKSIPEYSPNHIPPSASIGIRDSLRFKLYDLF